MSDLTRGPTGRALLPTSELTPANLGEPPVEQHPPEVAVEHRPRAAAGIGAIVQTTKVAALEMGLARSVRTLLKMNQEGGFDCQSCAWPSPDQGRKIAEFCENGVKAVADELTRQVAAPAFFAEHSITTLIAQSDHWLNAQGRLTHPMLKRPGATHFEPVSWTDAFSRIGGALKSLANPDEAIFYTSGKTVNETAFLFQLFARQFGTNNLPDCSNMCHEASGVALRETIGIGKGTVMLEDFESCDTILIMGSNPGTNHPRMLTTLEAAKRRGATIIAVNPLPETGLLRVVNPNPQDSPNPLEFPGSLLGEGTALADIYVPVRVNGDAALLQGILKCLLEMEIRAPGTVVDRAFLDEHTSGWDAFAEGVDRASWDEIVDGSGVDREMIEKVAALVAKSRRMIVLWCLGLTQHQNGVDNVKQVMNLLLVGGHVGREGAGPCCVRGHSNVQGDRTMGIWEDPPLQFLSALDAEMGIISPRKPGYNTVHALHALDRGHAKVFFAISGNLLSAAPDTHFTANAFLRCPLVVHVSTKLHRGHLIAGKEALILPCLGRAERALHGGKLQLSSTEDSMGIVNPTRGHEEPVAPGLLSETEIIVRLAQATLGEKGPVDWESLLDHDRVREHISRTIVGFEDFNTRLKGGFFHLPNAARERVFRTASGKAQFSVVALPEHDLKPGELLMTTVRSHDQFNTVVYGLDDRYRGVWGGRRVLFVNPHDLAELQLRDGQWVDITSHFEGETRVVRHFRLVSYPIARRSAASYFPEANGLVAIGSVDPKTNQSAQKCVRITLRPASSVGIGTASREDPS